MSGPFDRRRVLRRGLTVAGINALIGLGLGVVRGNHWDEQMVYAQAIGMSMWLALEFGRFIWKRDPETNWPIGWRAFVHQVLGVLVGLAAGWSIGDWYCGCSMRIPTAM